MVLRWRRGAVHANVYSSVELGFPSELESLEIFLYALPAFIFTVIL